MSDSSFEAQYPAMSRFEEIASLTAFVQKGSSCQLLGFPGVGRATVLSLLVNNRAVRIKHFGETGQKKVHFVLVNFAEIRSRPLFDVMKLLFLNLTESLKERKMQEENQAVGDIFREHLQFHDELVLFQGLKEAIDYLCLEKDISVVFLFDRFEEYIPTVTAEFFANLRTLRNRAKYKFSVVFSLYRPLEMVLEPVLLSDFFEFVGGNLIYLRPLDSVTTEFRIQMIEQITKKSIPQQTLTEIFTLAGGVGKLVKLSVEAVLAHENREDLKSFLLNQKTIQAALQEILFSLTPSEQVALRTGDLTDLRTNEYLSPSGLVKEGRITIPLFKDFLSEFAKITKQEKKTIFYDDQTNTIVKGEDMLSDQLTASEFRLLRFFLQNPDHITTREQLIDAVWGENKSTAGITDQAIDQLIFRLRRKIEEDANNPHHLQTVKGRGFKFIL